MRITLSNRTYSILGGASCALFMILTARDLPLLQQLLAYLLGMSAIICVVKAHGHSCGAEKETKNHSSPQER